MRTLKDPNPEHLIVSLWVLELCSESWFLNVIHLVKRRFLVSIKFSSSKSCSCSSLILIVLFTLFVF